MIHNRHQAELHQTSGTLWQQIFDFRKMLKIPALKGIYRYHEFIGPILPLESIIYLGEGHTPMVEASEFLQEKVGLRFFIKTTARTPVLRSRTGAWPRPCPASSISSTRDLFPT